MKTAKGIRARMKFILQTGAVDAYQATSIPGSRNGDEVIIVRVLRGNIEGRLPALAPHPVNRSGIWSINHEWLTRPSKRGRK